MEFKHVFVEKPKAFYQKRKESIKQLRENWAFYREIKRFERFSSFLDYKPRSSLKRKERKLTVEEIIVQTNALAETIMKKEENSQVNLASSMAIWETKANKWMAVGISAASVVTGIAVVAIGVRIQPPLAQGEGGIARVYQLLASIMTETIGLCFLFMGPVLVRLHLYPKRNELLPLIDQYKATLDKASNWISSKTNE